MMKYAILDDTENMIDLYKKAVDFNNERKTHNKRDLDSLEKRAHSGRGRGTTRNVNYSNFDDRGGGRGRGRGRGSNNDRGFDSGRDHSRNRDRRDSRGDDRRH